MRRAKLDSMLCFKFLTFLEIKYLLGHQLGGLETFFSPHVTKLGEGVKYIYVSGIILICITSYQKQTNSPSLVRQVTISAVFATLVKI